MCTRLGYFTTCLNITRSRDLIPTFAQLGMTLKTRHVSKLSCPKYPCTTHNGSPNSTAETYEAGQRALLPFFSFFVLYIATITQLTRKRQLQGEERLNRRP